MVGSGQLDHVPHGVPYTCTHGAAARGGAPWCLTCAHYSNPGQAISTVSFTRMICWQQPRWSWFVVVTMILAAADQPFAGANHHLWFAALLQSQLLPFFAANPCWHHHPLEPQSRGFVAWSTALSNQSALPPLHQGYGNSVYIYPCLWVWAISAGCVQSRLSSQKRPD
jgi:hypothetical protein